MRFPAVLFLSLAASGQAQPDPAFAPIQDSAGLPRVLLIGDSISIGYTLPLREMLQGKANVHRIGENGGPTSRGVEKLEAWLGGGKWDAIHFNFGLHDLRLMDDGKHQVALDRYEENLRTIVARLKKTGARLIWASTTPVPEGKLSPPRRPADVPAYNAAALRVMRDNGVEVNDLYAHTLPRLKEWQRPENVHFVDLGSRELARQVAATLAAGFESDIRAAEKRWSEAVLARDFATLEAIYTPDLIYAHSTGKVETRDEYLERLKSGKQRYDSFTFESQRTVWHGPSAVNHATVRITGRNDAGPFNDHLIMLHHWVRQGGAWRLAAHQTTKIP